ncbi:MAG TPA: hypothetical protein PLI09_25915 [Candidatus Hydrogenedentes bacterium]|nr:hypothetical protein [Candidatus Hydrogenedentota bacterium]
MTDNTLDKSPSTEQTPRRRMGITFMFVFSATVLIMLILNSDSIFTHTILETGDYASNAFAIRDAKSFSRLTGNYSRFGFNHPGPVFFYVYAAGEMLFHDLLKIVPCPFNAHVLAGLLFQAGFFALAIAIASFRIESPLFPPLSLVLCLLYIATLNSVSHTAQIHGVFFLGIWPPQWPLFPVLAFLSSCAALAAGGAFALPLAVFCGSVAVHAYVNMPAYIVPVFLAAYGMFLLTQWNTAHESPAACVRRTIKLHLAAALVLLLFITPIALDACRGKESNLAVIISEFRKHAGHHRALGPTIAYMANYFTFMPHGAYRLEDLGKNLWPWLASQWLMFSGWILAIGFIITATILFGKKIGRPASRHCFMILLFAGLWLYAALFVTSRIFGPFYFFISFSLFAIPILIVILLSVSIVAVLPSSRRFHTIAACLTVSTIILLPAIPQFNHAMSEFSKTVKWDDQRESSKAFLLHVMEKALATSPKRPKCVVLDLFSSSDNTIIKKGVSLDDLWFAAPLGLLLERNGISFYVRASPKKAVIFKGRRILNPATDLDTFSGGSAIWRIVPNNKDNTDLLTIPVNKKWAIRCFP